jgi:hypothetical protein
MIELPIVRLFSSWACHKQYHFYPVQMLCPCPLYLKESAGSFFESIGSKAVLEAGRRKQKSCACASLSSIKYVTILSHIYIEKALAIVPHPGAIASTAVLLAKPSGFLKNSYTE